MSVETIVSQLAKSAKNAAMELACCSTADKNQALKAIAAKLTDKSEYIKTQNARDLEEARKNGLSDAMIDRLTVGDDTIAAMAAGLEEVAGLQDPVGSSDGTWIRPNGLEVSRVRIPLGVIGIIYESRPNVTIDAAGLCLKSGNAVILRGGSEAIHSNRALAECIAEGLSETPIPKNAIQVVPVTDRDVVNLLLKQDEEIDLIIPRGGESLIRFVVQNSKIPVLKHYKGVCHVYVDLTADVRMAGDISFNAKVQRPGVCNAMETLLVHKETISSFLPEITRMADAGVEIRGCEQLCQILPSAITASEEDWYAEYQDLICAVKIVDDIDAAMAHIARYGSKHTEAIVTSDYGCAERFLKEVDSSVVLVNASTRFNDGGQLGLGAEMGISTSKLHAFGPMGLKELTTTKFVVRGSGQVRV